MGYKLVVGGHLFFGSLAIASRTIFWEESGICGKEASNRATISAASIAGNTKETSSILEGWLFTLIHGT